MLKNSRNPLGLITRAKQKHILSYLNSGIFYFSLTKADGHCSTQGTKPGLVYRPITEEEAQAGHSDKDLGARWGTGDGAGPRALRRRQQSPVQVVPGGLGIGTVPNGTESRRASLDQPPEGIDRPLNPASIKLQEPVIGGRAQIKRHETPMINKRASARAKSRALITRETRILEVGPTRRAWKKTRDMSPNPWNMPTVMDMLFSGRFSLNF